jgi:16S rRNA (cytosine1402-N4)-methyltransferase
VDSTPPSPTDPQPVPHKRRPRYRGTHPRRFNEKYKELDPQKNPDLIEKVIASGKTPAGTHRPIMVDEILRVLAPRPGQVAVDCTLGYGGHSSQILPRLLPGGRLIGIDTDPLEIVKTEARLRAQHPALPHEALTVCHTNFAALPRVLGENGLAGADLILADLGCSSMQLDDPTRGFSYKLDGPLDLRMNPDKGRPASEWLGTVDEAQLARVLTDNADQTNAAPLAAAILRAHAQQPLRRTGQLARVVMQTLPRNASDDERKDVARRVFQALRIEVNAEYQVLDSLLRTLPDCLNPGGCIAILTFHSGEDRRVKHAFRDAHAAGRYTEISTDVLRPTPEEIHSNPRASSAKLRFARR